MTAPQSIRAPHWQTTCARFASFGSGRRDKRGGGAYDLALDERLIQFATRSRELVDLDDALTALAQLDARRAKVVELRYSGGMSVEETAEVLGVHPNTVIHDWALAKAWLKRELSRGGATNAG